MIDYLVFCPSYKRSDIAITHKLFKKEKFCYVVREEEHELYRKLGTKTIFIPEGAVCDIAQTRNWILNLKSPKNFIMVDDDIKKFVWLLKPYKELTIEHLDHFIKSAFQMCEDYNVKFWGVNVSTDPINYRHDLPIRFNCPILGPFSGFRQFDLKYDERLAAKEDYDIFLQVMNTYKISLRFDYVAYDCDHLNAPGGINVQRVGDYEKVQTNKLLKKWGSDVLKRNWTWENSVNLRVTI